MTSEHPFKKDSEKFIELSSAHERVLSHRLQELLPVLRGFRTWASLKKSPLYRSNSVAIDNTLSGCEFGAYNDEPTSIKPKKFYRAVFWNLSGDLDYDRFLETVKTHPILKKADFFLFSQADIGMARTMNGNVVRSLALDLSYNYVFSCSYLWLDSAVAGTFNELGLTGQAIMTPHPLRAYRTIPVPSTLDPMRRSPKRIGEEKTLAVKVPLPEKELTLVCPRLDNASSPRQRAKQLKILLKELAPVSKKGPVLIAGGLNTTTYNSRHAFPQFFSFFNKIIRGYDYICEEHHPYPERFFERKIFQALKNAGFDYESLNEAGRPTIHCSFDELEVQGGIEKKISHLMVNGLRRFFYHGPERLALKVDWFAGNAQIKPSSQPQAERPKVLHGLFRDNKPVSTHDPIILDFEVT